MKELDRKERAVIIGSDGLWEFINDKLLVAKLVPYILCGNYSIGCRNLVKLASDKWAEVLVA